MGSSAELGSWDVARGHDLTWGEGHVWSTELPLACGTVLEFKAVVVTLGSSEARWEEGPNHVLQVRGCTALYCFVLLLSVGL